MTKSRTVASALGKIAAADTISSTGTLSVAGVTMIDSAGALPDSADASAGDMVMTSDSNELFISDGSVWYSIALINTNPYFTDSGTPESTYALSTEESATTVTLIAVDSEGIPITYSAVADSDFSGLATLSQDSSVFTITPLSEDSATTTSGTITFKASDGVNIATALSTFTLTFSILYSNNTVLLTKASGNSGTNTSITDSSTNSHTVNVYGNSTATSFSPYRQAGYSYLFDGDGDYITIPQSNDFAFGTGAYTVEAWIYQKAQNTAESVVFLTSTANGGFNLNIASTGGYDQSIAVSKYGTGYIASSSNDVVPLNEWTHIAVSREGTGTNQTHFFVNGILINSSTDAENWSVSTTGAIGDLVNYSGYDFNGYISDLRVIKGTALYTTDFTPPTDRLTAVSGTVLLTCHLPYVADGSSSDHSLTVNGNVSAKAFTPFDYKDYTASSHGGSVYFDGSGDYLTVANDVSLNVGSGSSDFTMECWVYPTTTGNYYMFSKYTNPSGGYAVQVYNGTLGFNFSGDGYDISSSTIPTVNAWNHVAVSCVSGTATAYLNGKSVGSTALSTGADSSNALYVGALYYTSLLRPITGYITDLRIVKGTGVYTAAFTPPTSPLTAVSGTGFLMNGQDAKVYDNAQNSGAITLSTANSSTGQLKYASSNLYVSGYATIANSDAANIFHDDGTLEFWMYPTQSVTNSTPIISSGWAGGVNVGWLLYKGNPSNYVFYASSGSNSWNIFNGSDTGITPWTSSWKHIAITRNGSSWTFYVDGSQVGQLSSSATPTTQTTVWIGSGSDGVNSHVPFYIEDLRFTKGLVRYPRIPAKETLTAVTNTKLLAAHTSSIIDGSDGALTATTNGNVAVSTFAPKQGMYSYALDGSGDYVTFAETAADEFTFGTGNLTAEAWVYPVTSKVQPAITTAHPNDTRGFWLGLNASNQLFALGGDGSGAWSWSQEVGVVPLNTWTHIAYVRSGNNHLGFINGTLVFTASSAVSYNNDNNLIAVGGRTPGSTQYFNGWISNARVLKGTALYTSSFTPPTAELKA